MPEQPMIEQARQNDPPTGREGAPLPHLTGKQVDTKKHDVPKHLVSVGASWAIGCSPFLYLITQTKHFHQFGVPLLVSILVFGVAMMMLSIYFFVLLTMFLIKRLKQRKENAG